MLGAPRIVSSRCMVKGASGLLVMETMRSDDWFRPWHNAHQKWVALIDDGNMGRRRRCESLAMPIGAAFPCVQMVVCSSSVPYVTFSIQHIDRYLCNCLPNDFSVI